MIGGGQ
jgi:hypothetical protein